MNSNGQPFGRFPKAELLIMTSLASGPKHGYALMEDIRHSYQARLGPGTLYAALSRLDAQGLIEAVPADTRRRPYRLTESGLGALHAALSELHRFAEAGLNRLATS